MQPDCVYNIETESGKFMAGVGNTIIANSPRRGINFVTRKITRETAKIITGEVDKIHLGNLDAKRDWGFSGEYVQAMWKILQQEKADDFVIATGKTHSCRDWLSKCEKIFGMQDDRCITILDNLKRPNEVNVLIGDASKAHQILKWKADCDFDTLAFKMCQYDLHNFSPDPSIRRHTDEFLF